MEVDANGSEKPIITGEVNCTERDIDSKNLLMDDNPCFRYNITGFAQKSANTFLVVEKNANCIWEFDYITRVIYDYSGNCSDTGGFKDGNGPDALYDKPHSIIEGDIDGTFYVTDFGNNALRKIINDSTKEVSTIVYKNADLKNPRGLTLHQGKVYIAARNYVVVVPTSCSRNCGYRLDVRASDSRETFCVLYDISVMNNNSLVVIDRESNDELKLISLSTNTSRPFPLGLSE